MSANISANFASTFWSARAPRRAWSKATVCSKNSTFAYFDGDAWALRLRSSTPISSYASDSKLVPVSTYTVTTSWHFNDNGTSTSCLFQIEFFVFSPILAVGSVWVTYLTCIRLSKVKKRLLKLINYSLLLIN